MTELGSYLDQLLSESPTEEAASALAFLSAGLEYQVVEAASAPVRAIALQEGLPVYQGLRDVLEDVHVVEETSFIHEDGTLVGADESDGWHVYQPDDSPSFEAQLPVVEDQRPGTPPPSSFARDSAGKGGLLGGRAKRELAYGTVARPGVSDAKVAPLHPSVEPMRRRAPAASFGPRPATPARSVRSPLGAPAARGCPDERPALDVRDAVVRPRTPAATFGTARAHDTGPSRPGTPPRPASAASSATATPASTPGRPRSSQPSPRSVLPASPGPKYSAVERSTPGPSFGRYSRRDFHVPGRGVVTVEEVSRAQAKRDLDLAAAYAATLPRQAAAKFGTASRFSWDFKGEALRARHARPGDDGGEGAEGGKEDPRGGKGRAAGVPAPTEEVAAPRPDLDLVRPRTPGAKIAPPPKPKPPKPAPEAPPVDAKGGARGKGVAGAGAGGDGLSCCDLVFRRVTVSRWQPPAGSPGGPAPSRRPPGLKRPAPGPAHYGAPKTEALSTRRRPPGVRMAPPTERRPPPAEPARPTRLTEAVSDVHGAVAAVRERAPATRFAKAPRFLEPPPPPVEGEAEPSPPTAAVRYGLVEPRPAVGVVAWRPPPEPRADVVVEDVTGEGAGGSAGAVPMEAYLPRHPAWRFPPPTDRPPPRLEPPLSPLDPRVSFVRPSAPAPGFGRGAARDAEPVARPYRVRHPEVGAYDVARAFDFLQRHVPAGVWALAARRWAGGALAGLLEGGEEAVLELSRAVALTRPSPPRWGFHPLPRHRRRLPRPHEGHELTTLDPVFTLVRRRDLAGVGWSRQLGRGLAEAAERRLHGADLGVYEPRYAFVEPRVLGVPNMKHMAGHLRDGEQPRSAASDEGPAEGEVLDLDPTAADGVHYPRHGMLVDMKHMRPRPGPAPPLVTAEHDLTSPSADAPLRPRVPDVHLDKGEAHRPPEVQDGGDPDAWKRGPGMYRKEGPVTGGTHEPIGVAVPGVDMGKLTGRPGAREDGARRSIADGDRLDLAVPDAVDAVRPRATAVPFTMERARPRSPGPYVGPEGLFEDAVYRHDALVWEDRNNKFLDFDRMAARWSADMPSRRRVPLPRPEPQYDFERGERVASNYPPAPNSYVRDWSRYKGRSVDAEGGGIRDGERLDLDVKDHLTRRRKPVPDFDGYLGRPEAAHEPLTAWVDYFPDDALLRPSARAVDFVRARGHEPLHVDRVGDLDAGVYDPSRALVWRDGRAVDFGRAGDRWVPQLTRSEGDQLFLHPAARQDVGSHPAAPPRQGRAEQPMGMDQPRWEGVARVPEDDRALFLRVATGRDAESARGKMAALPSGTDFASGPGREAAMQGLPEGRALQPGAMAEHVGAYRESKDARAIYGAFPDAHVKAAGRRAVAWAGPHAVAEVGAHLAAASGGGGPSKGSGRAARGGAGCVGAGPAPGGEAGGRRAVGQATALLEQRFLAGNGGAGGGAGKRPPKVGRMMERMRKKKAAASAAAGAGAGAGAAKVSGGPSIAVAGEEGPRKLASQDRMMARLRMRRKLGRSLGLPVGGGAAPGGLED